MGSPICKMGDYMSKLKTEIGYESMKSLHAKNFPVLGESSQIINIVEENQKDNNADAGDLMKILKRMREYFFWKRQ